MLNFILLFIYILLPLLVIFVERKNPTEAILWVLILLCFPYLGAILYLIFGSTVSIKLTSFIRNKRLEKRIKVNHIPSVVVSNGKLSATDKEVAHFNFIYNKSDITCYDRATIFTNGKSHYESLFKDIKEAKQYIFIEFYTIHNDMIGNALIDALTKKAKEGVSVLVMCDFIANLSSPKKMFQPLIAAGGRMVRLKPYLTHYRSHRKIVTIDHKISYIGGMNIGKQYVNMHKVKTPWRDTQVRIEGAGTGVLDSYFMEDWLCAASRKDWESTVNTIKNVKPIKYNNTSEICQFIRGGVENNKESIKMCYLSMIRSAKKRIRIQSPYFIPDASILDALKTASASGVQIEMIIPGVKASFFLDPVTNYYSGQIMEYGAKVYKYNGYIHAKTMVIDEEICCIGSVNMDMRSLMVDDEVCGVFYSNSLVKEYSDIFDEDIKSCKPYTQEDFSKRSRKEKIAESLFLPFAPLF